MQIQLGAQIQSAVLIRLSSGLARFLLQVSRCKSYLIVENLPADPSTTRK